MIEQYRLTNGMMIILERIPHVHSAAFGVWVKIGSKNETEENNGISHMIEHMVFKGTKTRSANDIADETAEIGGNVNAYTSKEFTSYYAWVLKENLPRAVELIGDMLLNSVFEEEELEKEKGIVAEEIDMYKDSPEDVVHEMLQKCIWPDNPLGYLISGEKENVQMLQRENLFEFMKNYYTADNMVISLAGAFEREWILDLLERIFGIFPKSKKIFKERKPIFQPTIYIEEKDIEQLHINIAFDSITSISEERYTFSVLNAILGGGVNSRLFMKIREEMGIAYSIYTYGSTFLNAGLYHLYVGLNANQLETCLEAIGNELAQFRIEGPNEKELFCAKEQIKTDIMIQNESTKGHMNSNAKEYLQHGRIIPLEEIIKKLSQIQTEDVINMYHQYFNKEKIAAAFVGNLENIKSERLTLSYLRSILYQ